MRNLLFSLTMIACCMCFTLPANAEETFSYRKCGDCELVVKHTTNWLGGSWTTYGLAKNGVIILSPDCELLSYNKELGIFAFRDIASESAAQYHIYLFSDAGKCLYSGRHWAHKIDVRVPYLSFEQSGKYTQAVVHYYSPRGREIYATKIVGSFYRKNGKLYQEQEKKVTYDAPVE